MLNGSAKTGVNNSSYFCEKLAQFLGADNRIVNIRINNASPLTEEHLAEIKACDAVTLAFGLFESAIPGHLISAMEEIEKALKGGTNKPMVYAMVNCGFYEGYHNHLALDMVRHWSARSGASWGGGLGIGSGEMYGVLRKLPLGIGPKGRLRGALKKLAKVIQGRGSMENYYFEPNAPRFFFILMATQHTITNAGKFGNKKADLLIKPE
jgi:hypothetical protein